MSRYEEWLAEVEAAVPPMALDTLKGYVETGREPGSFIFNVLANDLMGAFSSADLRNKAALEDIVRYVYNVVPATAQGTREKVNDWIEGGGMVGWRARNEAAKEEVAT